MWQPAANKSQHLWMCTDRIASAELKEEWRHGGKYPEVLALPWTALNLIDWEIRMQERGARTTNPTFGLCTLRPTPKSWGLSLRTLINFFFLKPLTNILQAGMVWSKRNLHQVDANPGWKIKKEILKMCPICRVVRSSIPSLCRQKLHKAWNKLVSFLEKVRRSLCDCEEPYISFLWYTRLAFLAH